MMIVRMRQKATSSSSSAASSASSAMTVVMLIALVMLMDCGCVHADDKNITRLLNNQAIVNKQIMCVLEKSPCDQLGRQLKAALPEVILRNCRNCSPQQAQNAQKLTNFLQTRFPDVWAMLIRKYRGV